VEPVVSHTETESEQGRASDLDEKTNKSWLGCRGVVTCGHVLCLNLAVFPWGVLLSPYES
jgi:hypothetical protein